MGKKITKLVTLLLSVICVMTVIAQNTLGVEARKDKNAAYRAVFDANYYATTYPDVTAAVGTDANKLLQHYIAFGIAEGRNASAEFNAKAYRENNPDLNQAYGDNWAGYHEHYVAYGRNEKRNALPGKNNNNNQPKKTQPQAKPTGVIGSYTTKYDARVPRANNVVVAASRINGVVVQPGAGFSYTQTILPRTTANGYVNAPIFLNKKHAMGIGGGVCQVSSTLYAAMLTAGLPATERHPHSLPVPYIPAGMDATVAGTTVDLKFTNIYDRPLLITASADNGTLTVTLSLQ